MFPQAIVDVVNGNEFTVEISLGAFTPIDDGFNTLMNSANDNFALFRRVSGDFIEFKNASNARPKVAGGEEYFKNSTVTITFKVGGKCTMYVDGVQIGQTDATVAIGAGDLWFGHDLDTRNFEALYKGMRFYSAELTADQVAANYYADQMVDFLEFGTLTLGEAAITGTVFDNSESTLVSLNKSYEIVYVAGGKRTDGYAISDTALTDGTKHDGSVGGGQGIDAIAADFILDLGEVNKNLYKFGADLIGGDWGIAEPNGITIQVSEDGETFYNVGSSTTKVDNFFVVELDHTVAARYINFVCDAGSHVWLSEIEVYEATLPEATSTGTVEDDATIGLVSLNKTYVIDYVAGGQRDDGYAISDTALTDGTKHDGSVGGGQGINAATANIILDLGEVNSNLYKFGADLIGGDWGIAEPNGISVAVSEDGVNYYMVGSSTEKVDNFFMVTLDNTVSARYICFICDAGSHVWLSEIEAYEAVPVVDESEVSEATSSETTTPETSDTSIAILFVTLIAMFGVALVVVKRRRA